MEIYPETIVVGRIANPSLVIGQHADHLSGNIFSHGTFGDILGHLRTFGQFL
jgi:hypothetical protein